MVAPAVSEAEFVELVSEYGPAEAARKIGVGERKVYERIKRIETKTGKPIPRPDKRSPDPIQAPGRLDFEVKTGYVVVGGDAHYWPGIKTTAHAAFVKFCETYHPKAVVMNGDIFDGASISRHAPIAWEDRPNVVNELEACKERLSEIKAAVSCKRFWPLGNHDARFEARLAQAAPEYANVHGLHLKDHFPDWEPCWSLFINDSVVFKHRYKGGIHATHNNTLYAGKTIITNHLHSAKVTPFTDYNGDRWGVDTGTLAEPYGPQFAYYLEDNPRNWRSGFAALRFENYELLTPQLVRVVKPGVVDYCNRLWDV